MIYYDYTSVRQDAQQRVLEMQQKSRGGEPHGHQEHHGQGHHAGHGREEKSDKILDKILADKEIDIEAVLLIGLVALLVAEGADMMLVASLLYVI